MSGMDMTSITVPLSCLHNNNITMDMYLLLHWKYSQSYELPQMVENVCLDSGDLSYLEYLESKGFIKVTGSIDFELRQKAIDLFVVSDPDKMWLEFLGTFPIKVPARNGGTRPLKVSDPDSRANAKPKAKYLSLIKGNPDTHRKIMSVLNAELEMRKKSNNMQYMNAIDAWLNQANYEKYAYLLEGSMDNSSMEDNLN